MNPFPPLMNSGAHSSHQPSIPLHPANPQYLFPPTLNTSSSHQPSIPLHPANPQYLFIPPTLNTSSSHQPSIPLIGNIRASKLARNSCRIKGSVREK